MSKVLLALGAAAMALTAPAYADRDNKGGDKGGQSAKADRGNPGKGGGESMKAERGNGGGKAQRQAQFGDRGKDKIKGGDSRQTEMKGGKDRKDFARDIRGNDRNDRVRIVERNLDDDFGRGRGFNGCPPGLDKKDNGCLPPGQAMKYLGARIQNNFANSLVPYQYRSWYRDDDNHFYRSGDGFMYRVSRSNNLVDGIIPLFGGGSYYAMGDQWPEPYNFYNVPQQYRSYYADGGDYNYRYGDGAIYRVNSGSGVVDSIVALLAGDLGVGTQLPMGYDTYNVPFSYRDRYYDTADNWYRYNDGYIYQVDPKTRLISAVIDAIV